MRFLGIGDSNDLLALYLQLDREGHEVRVQVRDPEAADVGRGLVPLVEDWRAELEWIRAAGREGVVLFETATDGALQDSLRAEGFQVIGGSAAGDRLESRREAGQQLLATLGLRTAETHVFTNFEAAARFIRERRQRYVYKPDGAGFASTRTYVGQLEDGTDLLAILARQSATWPVDTPVRFILMDHLSGVEMGVGAYFDGRQFLRPACLDWEHKRFFPGDLGELTGEMGTLATYDGSDRFFEATLARMEPWLSKAGYCGYINLNTVVNADGVWPLEFTCRFGYPGYAVLSVLQRDGWAELFRQLLSGEGGSFRTTPGFSVAVVLTVPPFPHRDGYARLSKGLPIVFRADLDAEEQRLHLHPGEVTLTGDTLLTSGSLGYVMVATGAGHDVAAARQAAYRTAARVVVPNLRYRLDIGQRFIEADRATLERLGWLSPPPRDD
jgi:phosphoribosylamine---glycine ligase